MSQQRSDLEFDQSSSHMYAGEALNGASRKQRSGDSVIRGLTSGDSPSNFNVMNSGFQQFHQGGRPVETVELPDELLLTSAFAKCNMGDGLVMESSPFANHKPMQDTRQRRDNLFFGNNAQGTFNQLSGAGWQCAENYHDPAEFMNRGVDFGPDQLFPLNGHFSPPCINPEQVNQSQLELLNIQQEQLCKMIEQRNLYLQWLQSQMINANLNLVSGQMNQNEGHLPQSYGIPKEMEHWGVALPYGGIGSTQFPDNISQQYSPRKILKRPNSFSSSFRASKLGSDPNNDYYLNNLSQFGKTILRSQLGHNSYVDGDCFHLGSPRQRSPKFSSINGLRGADMLSLPQDYGHVEQVRGSIYRMAKDQNGCRYLQRKFSDGNPEEIEIIFSEVLDHIADLMTDPFGNYLVQKLLEVCNENMTTQILRVITRRPGELIRISCDTHGTRAVQKILQNLKTPEQFSTVAARLKPGMVTLMKNTNGNHVAKCCLEHFAPRYSEFVLEVAAQKCVDVATDRNGCCVLQKCLSCHGGIQKRRLAYEIAANSLIISQNQYGNYAVQYILLHIPEETPTVLDQLRGHFVELSMQKYSSNVVEKCIQYSDEDTCRSIIIELITSREFDQVMQDPYGNYVIQVALNSSKGELKTAILEAIKPYIHILRTSPFGKKVLSCSCLKNFVETAEKSDHPSPQELKGAEVWDSFSSEPWEFQTIFSGMKRGAF